jgi:acid stress-induced BolA-like protein IbaG/YrbA
MDYGSKLKRWNELMLAAQQLAETIVGAIPDAQVEIRDLTGAGNHFEAAVVSAQFAGKSMIAQHQLVYAPLKALLATGELHALALKTYTPEQWTRHKSA